MTAVEVEMIICEWALEYGVKLTEIELNALVDRFSQDEDYCGAV